MKEQTAVETRQITQTVCDVRHGQIILLKHQV